MRGETTFPPPTPENPTPEMLALSAELDRSKLADWLEDEES
jgi:hypothetical protein